MVVRSLMTILGFKAQTRNLNNYSNALRGLTGNMGTFQTKAGGFSNMGVMLGGIARSSMMMAGVAVAAIGAVGTALFKGAGDIEQYEIAFETMLGSVEKADVLMRDITQFAEKTPFQLTELIQGSKQLLAYGVEQEKIIQTMTNFGNVAAGVGKDKLPSMIRMLGRVKTKGRADLESLNIAIEAGVPILEELRKGFGVTSEELFKMISAGKVGYTDVEQAFESMAGANGRFANLMEKQSKSLLGIFSNIKDAITNLVNSIGKELLPDGKRLSNMFLNWVTANKELIKTNVVGFFKGVIDIVNKVKQGFEEFKVIGNIIDLFNFLIAVGNLFGDVFDKVFGEDIRNGVSAFSEWLEINKEMIGLKIAGFFLALADVFEDLLITIKPLIKMLFSLGKKVLPIIGRYLPVMHKAFKLVFSLMRINLGVIQGIILGFQAFFALLRGDKDAISRIAEEFKTLASSLGSDFITKIKDLGLELGKFAKSLYPIIEPYISTLITWIAEKFGILVNFFSILWNTIKEVLVNAFNAIVEKVTEWITKFKWPVTEGFTAIKDFIVNIWNGIKEYFTEIFSDILSVISPFLTTFKSDFLAAFTDVKTGITNIIADVVSDIEKIIETVKTAIAKIKELASGFDIKGKISAGVRGVKDFFGIGEGEEEKKEGVTPANFGGFLGVNTGEENNPENRFSGLMRKATPGEMERSTDPSFSGIGKGQLPSNTTNHLNINAEITVPAGTPFEQQQSLQESAEKIFNDKMRQLWGNSTAGIPALEAQP